jgi:hypothetical protein
MNTQPPSQRQSDAFSSGTGGDRPVQTGALPGGQPGRGVNTSSSAPGQSNVDAAVREGVEYKRKNERPDR